MSGGRRFRRAVTGPTRPPAHVVDAARQSRCPDCDSDVTIRRDRAGIWRMTIGHDDGCPQLTFRQRHGMTTSVALVAEPGRTISRELVAEVTSALAEDPDVRGVRVATTPATTWQERQALTRATGEP